MQRSADAGHEMHAAPPPPHAEPDVVVVQVVPLQQPVGHVVASQTQLPLLQRWPVPHALFGPHLQAPSIAEHASAFAASHGVQAEP